MADTEDAAKTLVVTEIALSVGEAEREIVTDVITTKKEMVNKVLADHHAFLLQLLFLHHCHLYSIFTTITQMQLPLLVSKRQSWVCQASSKV